MNKVTEAMRNAGRFAHMVADGCGCTLNGTEHVFCDDPRLPDHVRCKDCMCKIGADAAIEAALSAKEEAEPVAVKPPYWMLEFPRDKQEPREPHRWWGGMAKGWTYEADLGLHYSRKVDAERAIAEWRISAVPTEHVDIGNALSPFPLPPNRGELPNLRG